MVFQQFGLLLWWIVFENVGFGLELVGVLVWDCVVKVDEQLKLVGLVGWGEKYVYEFLGGMQQWVGLVWVFVIDVLILLMDELFFVFDFLIWDKLQDELFDL